MGALNKQVLERKEREEIERQTHNAFGTQLVCNTGCKGLRQKTTYRNATVYGTQ